MTWARLTRQASEEVEALLRALPPPLQDSARRLSVTFEPRPNASLLKDGLDPDLLGLFVGSPVGEEYGGGGAWPPQMLLFLENIWEFAEGDLDVFREEVHTTFLHELGHYLGLDEEELGERGLE